jgi:hypothetical protein
MNTFLEATMLVTQQTVKKIKRYPYSGPQLKVLGSETQPIGEAEGTNMSTINKQTNKNMLLQHNL